MRVGINTRNISLQISALRKNLITDDLERRLHAEMEALDLAHVPLQTKDISAGGQSLFSVGLKGASKVRNSQILSEGEQRALALACYLAEVGGDDSKYGLIIDDPVSSLDHLRVRRVARRLVAEAAKGRQVVIFTHNIVFFNEIVSEAARLGDSAPIVKSVISKNESKGFGIVSEDSEPWISDLNGRISTLRERVRNYRLNISLDAEARRRAVKDFYSDLRESWERAVEEVVLAKTIVRFVPDVMTLRLKEICLNDDDYKTIFFAMKRVSERSGHDMSAARNITLPSPDEMDEDVKALDDFRVDYKKRSKATGAARSALESAAKAKFAD